MKLTNDHRSKIAAAVASKKFDALIKEATANKSQLAVGFYHSFYTESILSKMNNLPEEAFVQCSDISLKLPVETGDRTTRKLHMNQSHKVFAIHRYYIDLHISVEEMQVVDKAIKDHNTLTNRKCELEYNIRTTLTGLNTDKQVLEVWPEIEPILTKIMNIKLAAQLPAVAKGVFNNIINNA